MNNKNPLLDLVYATLALAIGLATAFFILRMIDKNFLEGAIKDQWGRFCHDEDWSYLSPLPQGIDYSWLDDAPRPILIAHALGEAGLIHQNSLSALHRALGVGLHLLEVDVWLDEDGQLRCHHGPSIPPPQLPGECSLQDAALIAAASDAWLILDIKTNFLQTGEAIIKKFRADPTASRLIFQIYSPTDLNHFSNWASLLKLPGPIVSAYKSHRSLRHIFNQLDRLGVKVFTYPLYRGEIFDDFYSPNGVVRLVHPVHDCIALKDALRLNVDGFYTLTMLVPRMQGDCEKL